MLRIIKQYKKILNKSQLSKVLLIFLCIFISGLLEMISISLMLPIIIAVLDINQIKDIEFFNNIFNQFNLNSDTSIIAFIIIIFFAVILIKNLVIYITKLIQRYYIVKNSNITQKELYNSYLNIDYNSYLSLETNNIINNINMIVPKVFVLLENILNLVSEVLVLIFLFLFMLYINKEITIVFCLVIILFIVISQKYLNEKTRSNGKKSNKIFSLMLKNVSEAITGFKEIKILAKENVFVDKYQSLCEENLSLEIKKKSYELLPSILMEIILMGLICIFILISITSVDNSIIIAKLSTLALVTIRLTPAINRINSYLNAINYYLPSLNLIDSILIKNSIKKSINNKVITFKDKIELNNVTYKYPSSDKVILDNVSLNIKSGSRIGIIGTTGSGKSTTIDLILGFLKPNEGKVLVDGVDICDNIQNWQKNIAYIPQMIFMLNDTILYNITFGDTSYDEKKLNKALKESQLDRFISGLNAGINTVIGERGIRISGGERQRIAIARALYNSANVFVFDEATSALDNKTAKDIMESIYQLDKDITIIIVSHNLDTLDKCDCIYEVKDSKIIKK